MAHLFSVNADKKHSVCTVSVTAVLLCIVLLNGNVWAQEAPVTTVTAAVPTDVAQTVTQTAPTTVVTASPPAAQTIAVPPVSPPPDVPATQTVTTTTSETTPSGPVSSAPPTMTQPPSNTQLSDSQFKAWLQSNGYSNNGSEGAGVSNTPTTPVTIVPAAPRIVPTFEESQQAIREAAPAPLVDPAPDSEYAFKALMQQNMPMTPAQVIKLRQQIDLSQRAAATLPNVPPKPVSTTLMVNLAPGTTPPAVRLAQGYVSALVFVDSTGTPWPIAAFDIGNPKAVSIQWDGKSNLLLIQAISPYTSGDIVVRLVGLPTPVTLQLVAGQRVVDYRVDLHISGIGPNTHDLPMGTPLPEGANQLLLGVLDGIAPAGSHLLIVHGADSQAWLLGEKMYLRTRLTVLSPGWTGKMTSPDGMQAYELPRTSTVLVSRYGEPAEIKVEGF